MNLLSEEKEKKLDRTISKNKALSKFARIHKHLSIKEKELLVANKNLYKTFSKGAKSTPKTGAVEVESGYYKLILGKYR